ncbi:MAG TPA: hypothetical protein VK509_14485 [Polyangiales bacterium]|nr:hypothetical protein [Polyangiales bacterium]
MSRCALTILLAASLLIAISAPRAHAQEATYGELMRDAKREAEEGSYAAARLLYRKSYAAQANAGSLLGAALASVKLEDFADAVRTGWAALAERHAPLDETERVRAERMIEDSLRKVAIYTVDAQPSSAEVAVDGEPVPLGPNRELVVSPGPHTVRALADGFVPGVLEVDAVAGKRDTLMFTLSRAAAPSILTQDVEDEEEAAEDEGESDFPVVPVIVLSVGVATLIAGGITGLIAVGDESELEDHCKDRVDMCPRRYIPVGESAEDFATATNVLWVVGGLITAVGTTWLIVELSDEDEEEEPDFGRLRLQSREQPKLVLAPAVAPRAAGFTLRATF